MRTQLALVALGSNLDCRVASLQAAKERLNALFPLDFRASPVYETDPIGVEGQPPYLNQAVCFSCDETPERLLYLLKGTEYLLGRRPLTERWSSRKIDLDLIALGETVIEGERLRLPHPEMGVRPFVLLPLFDLLPEWVHPAEGWRVANRLKELGDEGPGQVLRRFEEEE